jgi:hypothetical protein
MRPRRSFVGGALAACVIRYRAWSGTPAAVSLTLAVPTPAAKSFLPPAPAFREIVGVDFSGAKLAGRNTWLIFDTTNPQLMFS